jgi:hypothetical protein
MLGTHETHHNYVPNKNWTEMNKILMSMEHILTTVEKNRTVILEHVE